MDAPALTPLAAAVLHVPVPERALEIECREGDGVLFLAREFPSARIRGVDRSAEAIRRAIDRVGLDPEGRVAFKQGKRRSLPYPEGMFDLVVQQRGALFLGEVIRVLRPGGHLVYIEKPGLPFSRPRPGALHRGLRRHRFEKVQVGEAAGLQFHVSRLTENRAAHE